MDLYVVQSTPHNVDCLTIRPHADTINYSKFSGGKMQGEGKGCSTKER